MNINEDVLKKGGLKHFNFFDALAELPYVKAIYLFGSRARGDYWENSDIDLAIEYSDKDEFHRTVVNAIISEARDTFLEVDVVDYNDEKLSEKFRTLIDKEKVALYEAS